MYKNTLRIVIFIIRPIVSFERHNIPTIIDVVNQNPDPIDHYMNHIARQFVRDGTFFDDPEPRVSCHLGFSPVIVLKKTEQQNTPENTTV